MKNNGISWSYFAENLPGNGTICNLSDPGTPYSEDHNPFAYFQDVSGNPPSTSSQYCIQHERPYSEFLTDLQNSTVPQYNFIVPNDWDQGEKLAPGSNCKLCQADTWLSHNVPSIQASSAYQNGGAIFIVWDECASPGFRPSGLIVVSPFAKGAKGGYANNIAYNGHGSMVRTVEEIFGLQPFLGSAATSTDLSDLFTVSLTSSSIRNSVSHP